MISVYVLEDDEALMRSYRAKIEQSGTLCWAGGAGQAHEAIAALDEVNPDVLLVDIGLPDASGLTVVRAARERCPQAEVMVVSVFGDERTLVEALRAGASGYLLKDSAAQDFVQAIHDVRAGHAPISPSLARHLLNAWQRVADAPAPPSDPPPAATGTPSEVGAALAELSRREVEILRAVSRGLTFAEVGERMFISPHTVATHVKNIYRKLEAHSKVQALDIARRRGWLD
jgi:DNA-binding NarL/FixJ family response regulator